MKVNKSGYTGNIGSPAGYQPAPYIAPYIAAYAASKSCVLNFSEAIVMELEDEGFSVTCYSPGPTYTDFSDCADISKGCKFMLTGQGFYQKVWHKMR
jgi:short-subunit dehydrogenase